MIQSRTIAAAGLAAVAVLGMTACSHGSDSASPSTASPSTAQAMTSSAAAPTSAMPDPAANLVGSGLRRLCAEVSFRARPGDRNGPGPRRDRRVEQPHPHHPHRGRVGKLNPGVNLVDTLNGGQFTVIAPTDDAFAKIDAATLNKLKTDAPLLTSILTYHVIPGQLSPAQIVGTHKTVQGADVTRYPGPDPRSSSTAPGWCAVACRPPTRRSTWSTPS